MGSLVLKDKDARQSIVEQLDRCLLVEAGAGSGKTRSLVDRMVTLIKEGKCKIGTLAAVTFTRKAAAELKGRFQVALEKVFANETDPIKKERLGNALSELDRCFLGTIHSFCAAILRERPIEAGLDPEFKELDDLEDVYLRNKVWEEFLLNVQTQEQCKMDDLLKIDVSARDLKDCYLKLSLFPDVKVIREEVEAPDLKEVRTELNTYLDWVQGVLPEKVPPKGWDDLQKILRKALRWRRIFGLNDNLILMRLLNAINKTGKITQNRWPDKDNAKLAKTKFDQFKEKLINPTLEKWWEHRHSRLVEFVLPAVNLYQARRLEQSKLNYQDLLMFTADLLKSNPEVRQYFQQRYTHLLVDEFQDTDPIQAEIMFYLTGEDINEKDWRKIVPRQGSLFVVGDPKQAIYRFRRADIDTYNGVKEIISNSGGNVLYLTTNFRSVRAIGDNVNPVFKTLLPQEANSYQAAFNNFDTVRINGEGVSGVRINSIPKVNRNKQEEIVSIDAARIARWIRWAIDGNVKLTRSDEEIASGLTEQAIPRDFMILLRNKKHMNIYTMALEHYGIPFQIAGGEGLSNSEEITELIKVLRAIIDPDDPIMLAAALRGSFFGLSDRQFWQFKKAGGKFHIDSAIPDSINQNDQETFQWAYGKLKTYKDWILTLPGSSALEKILMDIGIIPYTLTGELGKSRSGYILQCLEFVANAERSGISTFSSLVDYLTLIVDSGVEEEINIAPWENDCVRLMNLHKAKGLEAPIVFLAKPVGKVDFPPTVHINRLGDEPSGYFVIDKRSNFTSEVLGQPINWQQNADVEKNYLNAEEIRLLYVAATRAKNLLVISTYSGKPELSPWYLLQEHLTEVAELDDCSGYQYSVEVEEVQLTREEIELARKNCFSIDNPINKASYQTLLVSAIAKERGHVPARKRTDKGFSWGRVIHRVLEAYVKNPPTNAELFVMNILAEEDRDKGEKDQVLSLVEDITKSPLWQRMLKSKQRFVEVPLSLREEGIIISGVIDLVFLEEDGWVIVDYKTDAVENNDHLQELVKYYTPQIQTYKKFWEESTNTIVFEAGLYFTSINKFIKI
ncbi:MAG: hypothetical protein FH758_08170 [Firmicutes bacterium]|nr:hypothetical protein [Bacillota bacterium]